MRPTTDTPPSLSAWIDGKLRQAILDGELRPGDKLRGEHLAAEWGVSATPLREAFARLAGEGLISMEPQRGARVAAIDVDDAVELYELRLTLEPQALEASMGHADDAYRAGVTQAYRALGRRHDTVADYLNAHKAFHLELLMCAGNRRLLALVARLHDDSQRFQVARARREYRDARAEHAALVEAVLAGDTATATRLLSSHLRGTLDVIQAMSDDPAGGR